VSISLEWPKTPTDIPILQEAKAEYAKLQQPLALSYSDCDYGRGTFMRRERALKIVLVLVGLLFSAAVYPLMMMVKQDPALAMMMSLYATLGVFLLLAARNPSEHRSLIAFTAWSSFAHAALMAVQAFLNLIPRRELAGVVVFILIGVALIVLAPAKPVERISAALV
jgi:hypothetical protein